MYFLDCRSRLATDREDSNLMLNFLSIVFTPLFLGAELHVPTADDIGTPGRLAEWMADSEVTVTHLTPGKQLNSEKAEAVS